ncbi:MAG: TIR domain-containing protein [Hyphomicrobiales bacterium]|nr:TIR domain-containing protein [Hyphomicrobiales bacterium]
MARIFLSHSSANNPEAAALRDWLVAEGWDDLFLDLDPQRGIVAGERWERALNEAANRCEAVLFLVSQDWLASAWCLKEFHLAAKLNKRMFGVLVEDVAIDTLPPEVTATWQLVDLAAGSDHEMFRAALPDGSEAHVTFSKAGLARLKAGLTRAGLDARFFAWPPADEPDRPPYRGLKPLEAEDTGIFFGREAPTIETLDRMRGLSEGAPPRFLVILGASGAGKSSFLRAGLLPRLTRDDRAFLPLPIVRPDRAALFGETGVVRGLESACRAAGLKRTRAKIKEAIESGAERVAPLLAELAESARAPSLTDERPSAWPRIVLSIDQGEELFLSEGADEASAFLELLCDLVTAGDSNLIVVVTIRSDAYEQLQAAPALDGIHQSTLSLPPLPRGAYQTVIEGPAARLRDTDRGLTIEPALTATLLADIEAGGAKDALPLLAFTLERLFLEHGGDGDLTLSEYNQIGGIKGSIEAAVSRALKAADADPAIPRDHAARLALLRRALIPWLAGIDPATGAPRRRVARLVEIPEEARPLVDHLIAARLLATDVSAETGERTIEPAHEALLRQWGLLQGWLEEDFAAFATQDAVKRAASEWAANARDDAWLAHTAGRLDDAESLLKRDDFAASLDPTDRAYLAAARAADTARRNHELEEARKLAAAQQEAAERQKQVARRTLWAAVALGIVALAAGAAGVLALRAERQAVAALEAGTETTEQMVLDLARGFREREGISAAVVTDILDRAIALQRRLAALGGNTPRLQNGISSALSEIALAFLQTGSADDGAGIAAATAAAAEARDIASRLVDKEPDNPDWAGSLIRADIALGDALLRSGKPDDALRRYREALATSERVVSEQATFPIQRDLALSLNRVADSLLPSGQTDEALALYDRSRALRETLLADIGKNGDRQPDRILLTRDLAISTAKIGDTHRQLGDQRQALEHYQDSLRHRRELVVLAPDNTRYRRDLAVGLQRLGAAEHRLLNYEGALDYFDQALDLHRDLTRLDPGRLDWKFDLSVSQENVADTYLALDQIENARPLLESTLAIRQDLVLRDNQNLGWKRSLAVALKKTGDLFRRAGDEPTALDHYRKALTINRELVAATSGSGRARVDLVATLVGVSELGDQPAGRLEEALEIVRRLDSDGELPAGLTNWPAEIERRLDSLVQRGR